MAVGKERRADAGAERKNELHAMALDGAIACHVGIVADAHRLLPAFLKLGLQRKSACPERVKIEGAEGAAVLDDSGEPDRDAIELRARAACSSSRPSARRGAWEWSACGRAGAR